MGAPWAMGRMLTRGMEEAMTIENIKRAQAEARRFLDRVDDLMFQVEEPTGHVWSSKESGALRRASMDLTRALAEMRKP